MMTDQDDNGAELRDQLLRKYPGLVEMIRKGVVRLPARPNRPGLYRTLPSVTPPGTAARLLDEDRGDR
jgi:hypothetical protein